MKKAAKPLARQKGLIVQDLADETLVYDLERHRAHCLSRPLASLWRLCDGERTVPEIAARAGDELGTAIDPSSAWAAVQRLGRARLLAAPVRPPAALLRRREWMKRAATLAGLTLVSIAAPTAAQAVTCIPPGDCGAIAQGRGGANCPSTRPCCPPAAAGTFCKAPGAGRFCSCVF